MRIRDLQATVEYANCDGKLIVPVSPVGKWASVYVYDDKGQRVVEAGKGYYKTQYVPYDPTAQDPWGGCMKAEKPLKTGVLVDEYKTDRDGNKVGDPVHRYITAAAEIKGTWKAFLVLYAERVRKDWDAEEAKRLREEQADELSTRFKKIGLPVRIWTSFYRGDESVHVTWDGNEKNWDDIGKLLTSLEKKLIAR